MAVKLYVSYFMRSLSFIKDIALFSNGDNIVNNGSPSRIRSVRRISLGITTRPKSSIRLTIPVAFKLTPPCILLEF